MHTTLPPLLLEAVPNVSVGRDAARVDAIATRVNAGIAAGAKRDGSRAIVADVHRDADHDRSVFTIVGWGEALASGLEALTDAAVELIDLRESDGVHPRVGALDVLPVVALDGSDEARRAAHELVARVATYMWATHAVPVVAYGTDGEGAPLPGAAFAGAVRRGGADEVARRVGVGELGLLGGSGGWQGVTPHERSGVTLAGVRDVLVAFNVDLATSDVLAARAIAGQIRSATAGPESLEGVRALGLELESRGVMQVSTNVERYHSCGPAKVLEVVHRLAQVQGIEVAAAELVGLAPDQALMPLRYASTRFSVPLLAAEEPSLDVACARVRNSQA